MGVMDVMQSLCKTCGQETSLGTPYRSMPLAPSPTKESIKSRANNSIKKAHGLIPYRKFLVICGAILSPFLALRLPFLVGKTVGCYLIGAEWSGPIRNGEPDIFGFSVISWVFGIIILLIMGIGYKFFSNLMGKKNERAY